MNVSDEEHDFDGADGGQPQVRAGARTGDREEQLVGSQVGEPVVDLAAQRAGLVGRCDGGGLGGRDEDQGCGGRRGSWRRSVMRAVVAPIAWTRAPPSAGPLIRAVERLAWSAEVALTYASSGTTARRNG